MDEGRQLHLAKKWTLGERLGGGGFGVVFEAESESGDMAAAKLVPKAPGSEREMLFVDLDDARNIVPIIDSGETENHWALVMPRADKSLRQYLAEAGSLSVDETVAVLGEILAALADLDGRVVHRDLKPENVLLLDGHWCLADFGISRYAEATTAPDTHKYSMSPPYAAPERWWSERATIAADVYAVGVIAYELLTGSLPFTGPTIEAYREQHLHDEPPQLGDVALASGLATLIDECLYKAPGARPSPSNLLTRLSRLAVAVPSGGLAALAEANRVEAARRGERGRLESASRSELERRTALLQAACVGLARIMDKFKNAVLDVAPTATQEASADGGSRLRLGQAVLEYVAPRQTSGDCWGQWEQPAFDVVAHAAISVAFPRDRFDYEGRSHSLWYCDAQTSQRYQWFETAFMISALIPERAARNPFALEPCEESAKAVWAGMAEYQVAWPFTPLMSDALEDFIDRWASLFAAASKGELHHPGGMPERSVQGTWRRS